MIRAKGANKLTSWIHIFEWMIDSFRHQTAQVHPNHCNSLFLFKLYGTSPVPGMLHSKKTNLEAAPCSYIPRKVSEQETGYKCNKRVAWQSYPRCAFLIWITLVFVICDMAMRDAWWKQCHCTYCLHWILNIEKWANEPVSHSSFAQNSLNLLLWYGHHPPHATPPEIALWTMQKASNEHDPNFV